MGKKKAAKAAIPNEVIRSFQLERDLHQRAARYAEAKDSTFSAVARIALREYLERHGV